MHGDAPVAILSDFTLHRLDDETGIGRQLPRGRPILIRAQALDEANDATQQNPLLPQAERRWRERGGPHAAV